MNSSQTFSPEIQNLIATYSIIYKVVFKFGRFILATLIGSGIFWVIMSYQQAPAPVVTANPEADKLVNAFQGVLNQRSENKAFDIQIIQGFLTGEQLIQSKDNLVLYKGFVLPRMILIDRNLSLPSISDFASPEYDLKQLELWMKNMVFTKVQQVERTTFSTPQIALTTNIITDFNLDCLKSLKISDFVCNKYVSDFVKSFFVYKIDQDRAGFKDAFELIIKKSEFQTPVCDNLKNYVLYTNDISLELEPLFRQCGKQYEEMYAMFRGFSDIQSQLYSYITDSIYADSRLNAYKLLSTQQLIYNELSSNRFNQNRIDTYIKFSQELLKNPQSLESFYKDVMAFFNQRYLIPELNKPQFATTTNQIQLIKNTIDSIKELNLGSVLVGFTGLNDQIINKTILGNTNNDGISLSGMTNQQETLEELFKQQVNFPNLVITDKSYGTDTIIIKGFFTVPQDKTVLQVPSTITFGIENGILVIKSLNFEGYDKLNSTLPQLLSQKRLGLNEIYETLIQNIEVLAGDQKTQATICDSLTTRLKESLNIARIQNCSEGVAEIGVLRELYRFAFRNGKLLKIIVSNTGLQQALDKKFGTIQTDTTTLIPTILTILTYDPAQENADLLTGGLTPQEVLIYESFVQYMKTKPLAIKQNKRNLNQYLVEFSIQNIGLVGLVDISTLKMSPLYFKKDTKYRFSSFALTLEANQQPQINAFISDPLGYLTLLDKSMVEQYLKDTSF